MTTAGNTTTQILVCQHSDNPSQAGEMGTRGRILDVILPLIPPSTSVPVQVCAGGWSRSRTNRRAAYRLAHRLTTLSLLATELLD